MGLYAMVIGRCFEDCANGFQGERLTRGEEACLKGCAGKMIRATNKIGIHLADHQQQTTTTASSSSGNNSLKNGAS